MAVATYFICMEKSAPVTVRAKRAPHILICRKCLKRSPDGKAIKQVLKAQLRSAVVASDRKKACLVFTACVGICPKRSVVVTNGAYLARHEYLLIDVRSVESGASSLMQPLSEAKA